MLTVNFSDFLQFIIQNPKLPSELLSSIPVAELKFYQLIGTFRTIHQVQVADLLDAVFELGIRLAVQRHTE